MSWVGRWGWVCVECGWGARGREWSDGPEPRISFGTVAVGLASPRLLSGSLGAGTPGPGSVPRLAVTIRAGNVGPRPSRSRVDPRGA